MPLRRRLQTLAMCLALHIGDSCSRPKQSVSQTLRFLDHVDFYKPTECAAAASTSERNGRVVGRRADRRRDAFEAAAFYL